MTTGSTTLTRAIWPATSNAGGLVRTATLIATGCLLLGLSAQVRIPFHPVPFTMQTFVVLVIGLSYGPRLAPATVATYLLVGTVGAPVFAGAGAGTAVLTGATGGYLLGMLAASVVLGALGQRGWTRTRSRTLAAMLIGTALIFAVGVAWLATLMGWQSAVMTGLLPFLGSEAVKVVLASIALPTLWSLTRKDEEDGR